MGHGAVFIHDGVAYSGFDFVPTADSDDGHLWDEIKASEFHAAMEAKNAANAKARERAAS